MKIVADSSIPYIQDYFGQAGDLILRPGRQIQAQDVKDAEILLVRSVTQVNENLLQDSKVKFVGSITAGADHLDTKWLTQAGIDWQVVKGFNAQPVADYVLSIVAAMQRRGLLASEGVKAAIIGVGCVGRLVLHYLKLLNIEVLVCDPLRAEQEADFLSTPIDEIQDVDFISLHVPLTKYGSYPTHHVIDQAFLQRQKQGCILVNASRGAVIDEQALKQFGKHLHWCLDVWEHEPHIDAQVLQQALIATPHIAGYSVQSKMRGIEMMYQIAHDKAYIAPQVPPSIAMPKQTLSFSGEAHQWQDIVLGVFNPVVLSALTHMQLSPALVQAHTFDEMRHAFNYRYELAYTAVSDVHLSLSDARLLSDFGLVL